MTSFDKKEKPNDGKFLFLNQVSQIERFKGISIYTHLVNTGYKTKKGAPKYRLTVFRQEDDSVLDEFTAFEFTSRVGKPYFSVLIKE